MAQAILVTGGAGYVGSHACKALAAAGYRPGDLRQPVARPSRGGALGPAGRGRPARPRPRSPTRCASHAIDAVMHFAAFAYVGESVSDPELYYRNNVGGTLALLEAMREAGVGTIVFSSTCATYGIPERVPIARDHAAEPGQPLWRDQAGDRAGAALVRRRLWPALGGAALFQRRRRRSRRRDRRGPRSRDASDPAGAAARRSGRRAADRHLRHRLSDAGRHRGARLHPCRRSRRRACPRAAAISRRAATAPRSTSAPAAATRCAR